MALQSPGGMSDTDIKIFKQISNPAKVTLDRTYSELRKSIKLKPNENRFRFQENNVPKIALAHGSPKKNSPERKSPQRNSPQTNSYQANSPQRHNFQARSPQQNSLQRNSTQRNGNSPRIITSLRKNSSEKESPYRTNFEQHSPVEYNSVEHNSVENNDVEHNGPHQSNVIPSPMRYPSSKGLFAQAVQEQLNLTTPLPDIKTPLIQPPPSPSFFRSEKPSMEERKQSSPRIFPETYASHEYFPPNKDKIPNMEQEDDIRREKQSLLLKLIHYEESGRKLTRAFTMNDPLPDMLCEIEGIEGRTDATRTQNMLSNGLKFVFIGAEALNDRLGPFLKLDGWADDTTADMSKFKAPIEKIYKKFFKRASVNPFFEIAFIVVTSAMCFHFNNGTSKRNQSSNTQGDSEPLKNPTGLLKGLLGSFFPKAPAASVPPKASAASRSKPSSSLPHIEEEEVIEAKPMPPMTPIPPTPVIKSKRPTLEGPSLGSASTLPLF